MYINTTTNEYPVSEQDIKAAFPNVSFATPFAPPEEYQYVFPAPVPNYNGNTHRAVQGEPELTVLGKWQQVWEISPLEEELVAAALASAKITKNAQINKWRAEANQTYFTHGGKQIACDALSRSDIDAVAGSVSLNGTFPVGFPGAWKAVDNSYVMLPDVAAFKSMYASMTLQGTINFGQSQTLKATLAAATTIEQVNAVAWI